MKIYSNEIKISKSHFHDLINKIKIVKSNLIKLHDNKTNIINKNFILLLSSLCLLNKNEKRDYLIKVAPINNKNNYSCLEILQTACFKLINKPKKYVPFWDSSCDIKTKKLWIPELEEPKEIYDFKVKDLKPVNKNKKEELRVKKINLKPTNKTREIFKEWINTSRAVYNKGVDEIAKDSKNANFMNLRNKLVTSVVNKQNNVNVSEWMKNTPKDVRAGALKELTTSFKSCMTNLKKKNINYFELKHRTKKSPTHVIEIPKNAIKILGNKQIKIYNTYIKDSIKHTERKKIVITNDCKIEYRYPDQYSLLIPYTRKQQTYDNKKDIVALDPGIRKFMTSYSQEETRNFNPPKKIDILNKQIDKIKSCSKNRRGILKREIKINNIVKQFHYMVVNFLTKNYKKVLLPSFETQNMITKCSRVINNKSARKCNNLSHYKFKQRLLHRCILTNTELYIVDESYTSKTCGRCGKLNDVGASETYKCSFCDLKIDRDINGARNIFIRNVC